MISIGSLVKLKNLTAYPYARMPSETFKIVRHSLEPGETKTIYPNKQGIPVNQTSYVEGYWLIGESSGQSIFASRDDVVGLD